MLRQSLVLGFSVCLLLAAVSSAPAAQTKSAQSIDQMVDALGGETYLDVKDIHTTGRFFSFTHGDLSGSDVFSDYIKFPDMERTELGGPKNKSITINQGKEGSKVEGKKYRVDSSEVQQSTRVSTARSAWWGFFRSRRPKAFYTCFG